MTATAKIERATTIAVLNLFITFTFGSQAVSLEILGFAPPPRDGFAIVGYGLMVRGPARPPEGGYSALMAYLSVQASAHCTPPGALFVSFDTLFHVSDVCP